MGCVVISVNSREIFSFLNEEKKSSVDFESYDYGFAQVKSIWLEKVIQAKTEYKTIDQFLFNYTTDDTEGFLFLAEKENAIINVFF